MKKNQKQITTILSESESLNFLKTRKKSRRQTEKVAGENTRHIIYGEDKEGKVHVYIDGAFYGLTHTLT